MALTRNGIIVLVVSAAIVVVVVCIGALLYDGWSEDGEARSVSATVYLEVDGDFVTLEGEGSTLEEILTSAVGEDHELTFLSSGVLASVDGQSSVDDRYWTVFRWSSPTGWSEFSYSNPSYVDGMSLAVSLAERVTDSGGYVSYTAPDIEVEYTVYYFLQVREGITTDWIDALGQSRAALEEGFWISGTGSNNNEALADAVISTFFSNSEVEVVMADNQIKYLVDGEEGVFSYGVRTDMYGWFLEFLGYSDTQQSEGGEGGYGTWTYWTQFSYNPSAETLDNVDQWNYNNLAFGMYDITEYRYFGLVLKTSEAEDQFIDIQTPSEIPPGLL